MLLLTFGKLIQNLLFQKVSAVTLSVSEMAWIQIGTGVQ